MKGKVQIAENELNSELGPASYKLTYRLDPEHAGVLIVGIITRICVGTTNSRHTTRSTDENHGMGTVTVDETMERDYSEALTMPHLDSCSEKFLSSEMLCAESAVGVR